MISPAAHLELALRSAEIDPRSAEIEARSSGGGGGGQGAGQRTSTSSGGIGRYLPISPHIFPYLAGRRSSLPWLGLGLALTLFPTLIPSLSLTLALSLALSLALALALALTLTRSAEFAAHLGRPAVYHPRARYSAPTPREASGGDKQRAAVADSAGDSQRVAARGSGGDNRRASSAPGAQLRALMPVRDCAVLGHPNPNPDPTRPYPDPNPSPSPSPSPRPRPNPSPSPSPSPSHPNREPNLQHATHEDPTPRAAQRVAPPPLTVEQPPLEGALLLHALRAAPPALVRVRVRVRA